MVFRAFLFAVLLLASDDDGKKQGRRGNALYQSEQYQEAVTAYREGLLALEGNDEVTSAIRYGLQNNIGAALHQMGEIEAASEAFRHALALSPTDGDYGRTSYNAGNTAFAGQDLEASLEYYKKSLLAQPDNMDAKFNYEFVKRRIEQQQNQQENQDQQNQEQDQNQSNQDNQQNRSDDQQEQQQQNEQQEQQQNESSQENEQQQQPPPEPNPEQLSQEQAERILQALQNEEEQLLRQIQRPNTRARKVEKDW